jgi:hypothetical protein
VSNHHRRTVANQIGNRGRTNVDWRPAGLFIQTKRVATGIAVKANADAAAGQKDAAFADDRVIPLGGQ